MDNYKKYVNSINTIFDILNKLKAGYDDIDNKAHIENIEDYKEDILKVSNEFNNDNKMETLGQ